MVPCGSIPVHLLPCSIHQCPKPYLCCHQTNSKSNQFRCSSSLNTAAAAAAAAATATTTPATSSTITHVGGGGLRKRVRNRKLNPGEKEGIVEEMRFVAMRLRTTSTSASDVDDACGGSTASTVATWQPTVEGFLQYLVDSKLVFDTLERIVEDSTDVTYVYFRRTGLERSASLVKDLDWFKQQGHAIPQPSTPGTAYASYLADLAEKSVPSFLCHFYNIYFAHIFGGCAISKQYSSGSDCSSSPWFSISRARRLAQIFRWQRFSHLVSSTAALAAPRQSATAAFAAYHSMPHCSLLSRQVCEKLFLERKLEFSNWEADVEKLLKNARENLNKLGEHWPRIEKNKCLKEAAKSFKLSGQILRLIIL